MKINDIFKGVFELNLFCSDNPQLLPTQNEKFHAESAADHRSFHWYFDECRKAVVQRLRVRLWVRASARMSEWMSELCLKAFTQQKTERTLHFWKIKRCLMEITLMIATVIQGQINHTLRHLYSTIHSQLIRTVCRQNNFFDFHRRVRNDAQYHRIHSELLKLNRERANMTFVAICADFPLHQSTGTSPLVNILCIDWWCGWMWIPELLKSVASVKRRRKIAYSREKLPNQTLAHDRTASRALGFGSCKDSVCGEKWKGKETKE